MKVVHQAGGSRIVVEDRPRPEPGPGEVLIQTVVSAVCGSEMHTYHGAGRVTGNLGHEAAGLVVEQGKGVDTPRVGDRVGVSAIAGCGTCPQCQAGRYTWCPNHTFHADMHAEYFVIPARACHPLPDDVPWEIGVLITGDALGVPYHTSTKLPTEGVGRVAVFGLGPIGLGSVMLQTYLGREVIGIDRSPERVQLARQLGARHTVLVTEGIDVPARVRDLTEGVGADVCLEAAGIPATAKQCFAAVRAGGCVVFNGEQPAVELSPSDDFIRRDITAIGSWFYHFREYPQMLALYREGCPVGSIITHRFPLERAGEAYHIMEGKSGKVLLDFRPATTSSMSRRPGTPAM